jgi:hypothetical protein
VSAPRTSLGCGLATLTRTLRLAFVAWTLAASPARAAPDEQPAQQSARHLDAHADRVLLVPSAETHPGGTLFGSSYEVLLLSGGYALTDRVQASITGFTDLTFGILDLNLKANLLRSPGLRIAALSGIDVLHGENEDVLAGRAGTTFQICFELACRSSLSLHATLVLHDQPNLILPLLFGAGFTVRISDDVSGLLEYSGLANPARDLELIELPVYLIGYGARISTHPSWALDLALLRPLQSERGIRVGAPKLFEFFGVPLVVFTYRGAI